MRFNGNKIAQLRRERGWSQRELGVRMGFPNHTAQQRVSFWERGTNVPHADTIALLAATLDCGIRDLYTSEASAGVA